MNNGCGWDISMAPAWNWLDNDYRIKPKQKVKKFTWAHLTDQGNWYNSGFYMSEQKAHEYHGNIPHIKIESSMIEVDE